MMTESPAIRKFRMQIDKPLGLMMGPSDDYFTHQI